jgi:hypothetical protein
MLSSGAGRYSLVHSDWTKADRFPENLEQHIACSVDVSWTEASFGGDAAAGAVVEGPFDCPTPTSTSRAPPCYRTWQVDLGRALKLKRETSRQYEERTFLRYARLRDQELARTLEALLPWPNPALVPVP